MAELDPREVQAIEQDPYGNLNRFLREAAVEDDEEINGTKRRFGSQRAHETLFSQTDRLLRIVVATTSIAMRNMPDICKYVLPVAKMNKQLYVESMETVFDPQLPEQSAPETVPRIIQFTKRKSISAMKMYALGVRWEWDQIRTEQGLKDFQAGMVEIIRGVTMLMEMQAMGKIYYAGLKPAYSGEIEEVGDGWVESLNLVKTYFGKGNSSPNEMASAILKLDDYLTQLGCTGPKVSILPRKSRALFTTENPQLSFASNAGPGGTGQYLNTLENTKFPNIKFIDAPLINPTLYNTELRCPLQSMTQISNYYPINMAKHLRCYEPGSTVNYVPFMNAIKVLNYESDVHQTIDVATALKNAVIWYRDADDDEEGGFMDGQGRRVDTGQDPNVQTDKGHPFIHNHENRWYETVHELYVGELGETLTGVIYDKHHQSLGVDAAQQFARAFHGPINLHNLLMISNYGCILPFSFLLNRHTLFNMSGITMSQPGDDLGKSYMSDITWRKSADNQVGAGMVSAHVRTLPHIVIGGERRTLTVEDFFFSGHVPNGGNNCNFYTYDEYKAFLNRCKFSVNNKSMVSLIIKNNDFPSTPVGGFDLVGRFTLQGDMANTHTHMACSDFYLSLLYRELLNYPSRPKGESHVRISYMGSYNEHNGLPTGALTDHVPGNGLLGKHEVPGNRDIRELGDTFFSR